MSVDELKAAVNKIGDDKANHANYIQGAWGSVEALGFILGHGRAKVRFVLAVAQPAPPQAVTHS